MSSPAMRNIKRLQPQDKRSRKIFLSIPNDRSTQDCHWRLRRFSKKGNHLGCPKQGVPSMCDYSLHHVASRPAKVGDKLVTTQFNNSITRGFAAVGEPNVAVCLLPGTEVAFEKEVEFERGFGLFSNWTRQ